MRKEKKKKKPRDLIAELRTARDRVLDGRRNYEHTLAIKSSMQAKLKSLMEAVKDVDVTIIRTQDQYEKAMAEWHKLAQP